jgi:hypothetical protein
VEHQHDRVGLIAALAKKAPAATSINKSAEDFRAAEDDGVDDSMSITNGVSIGALAPLMPCSSVAIFMRGAIAVIFFVISSALSRERIRGHP